MKTGPLFTSDLHLFHNNAWKYMPKTRPFSSTEEMNESLVRRWNKQVDPGKTVYLLGDVTFKNNEEAKDLLLRLNGKIHLILGNHDNENWLRRLCFFESIQSYKKISLDGIKVMLFHFPIAHWDRRAHGSFHLHGHSHGHFQNQGRSMDVGIDARAGAQDDFLFTWDEIKQRLLQIEYKEQSNGNSSIEVD